MANIPLKSIKFPDLADTYTVPSNAGELPYDKSATYPADTVGKALQDKPDADGIYPDMTVGNAEQLVSNVFVEDKVPYRFRTAGGSVDIGKRAYFDAIVGGTVGWNQLVDTGMTSVTVTSGHKYRARINSVESIGASTGTAISLNDATKDNVTDLTQMLGSTIADYIYSLEQATAGAGVAFFRKYFPNAYYPYNAGELVSVSGLSAHKTTGFNQWDEEWEVGNISPVTGNNQDATGRIRCKNYIPVVPNADYYLYCGSGQKVGIFAYDANKEYIGTMVNSTTWQSSSGTTDIGNLIVHTPPNAYYIKIKCISSYGSTYLNDICINLSWDGSRDGEYEEYKEHTYPLDDSLTLRGIPKLVDGKLQFDGDEYLPDGTVNRKYGVVDLGSLTYGYSLSTKLFSTTLSNIIPTTTAESHIISPIYNYAPLGGSGNDPDMTIFQYQKTIYITNFAYTSIDSFKSAMSGVYLVYELATTTTETAEPYSGIQIVDDFGTEEFVTTAIIPVGHITHYPIDALAKLEMMPNSPSGNGEYIVTQSGGVNEYTTLASSSIIGDIIDRIEALENA